RKVAPYCAAQVTGAFAASSVVFVNYREALTHFDGGVRQIAGPHGTAGIWATYPQEFLSTMPGGLIDQIVGTALLVAVIFALGDRRNTPPAPAIAPVVVGFLVGAMGVAFGYNAGYAINPASDVGPRLFTAIGGCGTDVFRAGPSWGLSPIVRALAG